MNLSGFTFFVTEECNFNCSYCYQKKEKRTMDISLVEKAVDFFSPFFKDETHISFYGGEPLLAFEIIERAVEYIEEKKLQKRIHYSLTTNGSLVDERMLDFFNRYKFSLLLSFDGLAQDIFRKKGSFDEVLSILKKMSAYPDITTATNSVFVPGSVRLLSKSVEFIVGLGIQEVQLSISTTSKWNRDSIKQLERELNRIKRFLISFYQKRGVIPVDIFMKKTQHGLFGCNAGKSRMTLAADGKLWGCYLFLDYFKGKEETKGYHKYCFGDLDYFMKNHEKIYPQILPNYAKLRMDYFCTPETFCMLCEDLEECHICPVDAALSGAVIGNIPLHLCEIERLIRKERDLLWRELENKESSG